MSNSKNDRATELEFFKSALFQPAVDLQLYRRLTLDHSLMASFGAIEAAHWARLGAEIGYLNGDAVSELISSAQGLVDAFNTLKEHPTISFEDEWLSITLPKQTAHAPVTGRERDLLHRIFQTIVLLTAENLFEPSSRQFLDGISWAPDLGWNILKSGSTGGSTSYPAGTVQHIGYGLANVWNYWGEVKAALDETAPYLTSFERLETKFTVLESRFGEAEMSEPTFEKEGMNFPRSLSPMSAVNDFIQYVRAIISPRFNLGNLDIVERYFAITGEFLNTKRENTPEWQEAQNTVFQTLGSLIAFFGGERSVRQAVTGRLWKVFTRAETTSESAKRLKQQLIDPDEFLRP